MTDDMAQETGAHAFGGLLRARFSCRAYRDDPVPRAVIQAALADAQHVPSWCNSQPWKACVTGASETARLAQALFEHSGTAPHASDLPFPARYEGAYQDRRRTCGLQLYEAVGVEKGDRVASARQMRENFRLFGAPHFVLITSPKNLGTYGALDCGAYVTALLLALQARGVASIPMASVAGFSPFMRDWFAVEEDRDVLCGVAFGYADLDAPANGFRTDRAAQDEVVDWRWD
ncbi:MAG: nitroreductase [Pelagimonas sp.]|jgi:nitroreductase|nr:nitroreductase [Pelagimonas sp.]